jgi:hypothetical protein
LIIFYIVPIIGIIYYIEFIVIFFKWDKWAQMGIFPKSLMEGSIKHPRFAVGRHFRFSLWGVGIQRMQGWKSGRRVACPSLEEGVVLRTREALE